ncbi:hypothetical protein SPRG_08914 [Saprolegnia parasitica CBS 223.65]|uniref:FYVE-type domain-containing protein n=1 Tax=Saprolegnia parasitica (strain CBS 223.65) TaxID=695850 RepID=A0A067C8X4_SAPPC|nr:hypothetical protein SPRG_08914 [Saprolegnia parasitica CBS 223.65]KDO25615.1 hypothetical protein SPRG_08914 [Saprolegnia parasitica CBS 223.65]|eukprot:XP_012203648.1 hypothetical protein SPRG_08914 [Saprolegnia parasitica CBS 223.65]
MPAADDSVLPGHVVRQLKRDGLAACHAVLANLSALEAAPLYAKHLDPTSLRRMELRRGLDTIDTDLSTMLGRTTLAASLDEIAAHLPTCKGGYLSSDAVQYEQLARLGGPTRDKPWQSTVVAWLGIGTSDYCVVETQLGFTGASAQRGLLRVVQSVELPHNVCLPRRGFNRRSFFRVGHIFLEPPPSKAYCGGTTVDAFAIVVAPIADLDLALARRQITSLMALTGYFQRQRLTKAAVALANWRRSPSYSPRWVEPKAHAKHCAVCQRRFHPLRPKTHCELDGRVVCFGCSAKWMLLPSPGARPIRIRICDDCVQAAVTKGPLSVGPKPIAPGSPENSSRLLPTLSSLTGSRLDTTTTRTPPRMVPEMPLLGDIDEDH